ncbi:MAG: hypothetical protein IJW82_01090, partial [Clostridia bacterium]|nr:hypothetical protein [Clostridia bacterium]
NQENNQNKNKHKTKNNIMVGNYNNLEGNNKKNINKSVCACDREPYIEFLKDYFYFCSIKLSGEQFNKGCEIIDKIISFRNDAILGNLKFKGHTYTEYEFLDKLKHLTFERFSNIMGNIRYGDNIENEEGYLLGCILHYPQKEVNENFGKLIKELEVDYEFGTD